MTDTSAATPHEPPAILGLILAAGSGSRVGRPKALLADADGTTWLARAVRTLADGGCRSAYAVIGAAADEVRAGAPEGLRLVEATNWAEGMGASLRAGLTAIIDDETSARAVLVMLVDTPGVTAAVVTRLVEQVVSSPPGHGDGRVRLEEALARSSYQGEPGHPVLLGRAHWEGVIASAQGDRGARDYLRSHRVTLVESGDVGSGSDIDTVESLRAWVGE